MLKRILYTFLPPPRQPFRWPKVLPLVIFLGGFLLTCLLLDAFDVMLFTRPWAFALLLIAPWIWWMSVAGGAGLTPGRNIAALLVRLSILGLFVILLAEPRAVRKNEALSVVYVLDTSDSLGPQIVDGALKFVVNTVTQKPEKDEAGLVVFGRDAAVELPVRQSFAFEGDTPAINTRVERDGTDLAKALSLALAAIAPENQGRVVLITDGAATQGDLARVLDEFRSRKIGIDVLPVEYEYREEVWLERLELPRSVKSGEAYEVSVILSSLAEGEGNLVLQQNGQPVFSEPVKYRAGKNRYTIKIPPHEPGYFEYTANIEVPKERDHWPRNNRAISYLYLKGKGQTLLVVNSLTDDSDWGPLQKALTKNIGGVEGTGLEVKVESVYRMPRDPLGLLGYDAIVLVNVPRESLDEQQMTAVHDAVKEQGSGLMMVGGPNSFGPGGWNNTPIETALPVSMDVSQRKVLPKGALAIILHTCEFPDGNTWGKEITKSAIKVLNAQDEVGVLVYDWGGGGQSGERWLFSLQPAANYEKFVPLINAAQIGDMPAFGPTMQMAYNGLVKSDAATKHMIIISDGDPQPPTPALVSALISANITVSTISIFPHGGQEIAVLKEIAKSTGGRYYSPNDTKMLPQIFIKEAKTLKRSMIQEFPEPGFLPDLKDPSPIMKGIPGTPRLTGYILTTPKPRSSTVLEGPDKEDLDPVLSTWRFGLGKSAAFTSDLSPRWSAKWTNNWDSYDAFARQLITDIARVDTQQNLRLQSFADGDTGVIQVEDYAPDESFLQLTARVEAPDGTAENVPLKQVAARRYEGRFPLVGEGRYQVTAVGTAGSRNERAYGGFVLPYSQEYLRFRANPEVLKSIAARTNGRVIDERITAEELFGIERVEQESSRPVPDWFLIALACLIPLDVGFRRVQIDWELVRTWLNLSKRREAPTEAMGSLLRVKQRVGEGMKRREEQEVSAEQLARVDQLMAEANQPKPKAEGPRPAAAQPGESVTSRLLAAKKRAGTSDDDKNG